jgi:prepilin-type N-terminal cleavage/methylation domain-containing protein
MQRGTHPMYRRKNCGLTLIELLIAMLLSSIVLLTAYTLLNYQQHYFAQHKAQIQLEQNKRFAQFMLSNAIRQAGFFGCRSLANSKITNHASDNKSPNNKSLVAVFAYQAMGSSWRPALPAGIKVKPGTDVLAIMYVNPSTAILSTPMLKPTDYISLNKTSLFNSGDIVVISDCEHADIFTIKQINGYKKQLQHTTPLSKAYGIPTEVGQLMHYLFYIQPDDSLYMLDNSKIPEELVDHISNLKLLFATLDAPSNFVTANAINDWSQVHSVEVELPDYSFITSLRNQ